MRRNIAGQKIGAQLISSTDGSAFSGVVTVYITGDAGTQAVGSVGGGVCSHEGEGYHTYSPSQSETDFNLIAFTFTGTGAIPVTVQVYTEFDVGSFSASGLQQLATGVWEYLYSAATTVGTIGKLLVDYLVAGGTTILNVVPSVIGVGDVRSDMITAYVSGAGSCTIAAVDSEGTDVPLPDPVTFCVETKPGRADLFTMLPSVSGNEAAVEWTAADVPTVADYCYSLRDTSTGRVYAEGVFRVKYAALKDS